MKRIFFLPLLLIGAATGAWAGALSSTARNVIPAEVQQLIAVDYRAMSNSPIAMALKERVLPEPLKKFETALRGSGVSPESDVEQLVFASFRTKDGLRVVGVAEGQFFGQKILQNFSKRKIKGEKYRTARMFPMGGGMYMSMIDSITMVFGDSDAVKTSLDVRDGEGKSVNFNAHILELLPQSGSETVWSVLDEAGTRNMLISALGDASDLADYDLVKKRLRGSRYTITFANGVDFDMDVVTSDQFTAGTLSSLLQAGVLFRKASATAAEKTALESLEVKSENRNLKLQFKTDDEKFKSLLSSDLFKTVSK